ncbi:terminase gpP N-terminus-related DNA-binding protein [Bacillus mycoides]|uniref:terminase gpP N-terminus-related DNA-binding protein n=1 Tax=Bacillus mycoides TaxID=1405 RepID=UPI001FB2B266|nr:sigma factor-like helix-turn-helix DNA-binding protein [Bacillus mycoides]UNP84816.1 transposase [Bacillus mycoides]
MKQKHELAQEDYMQGMKYKDIAEKHDVSVNTVKSWKTRYKWNRKGVHTKDEKVRTQKKTGAPVNNKNAVGNPGNRNPKWGNKNATGHGAPKGNHNAMTHGLYATVLYEHLSDEDRVLFDLSQDIEGQEQELQVARFKLAKLIQNQKELRLKGMAVAGDGAYSYTLRDDFYTDAINKALDMISKIETRIDKSKLEREKLQAQLSKMRVETEFIEERIKLLKGQKKDTSLLDALIEGRKQYEQNSD